MQKHDDIVEGCKQCMGWVAEKIRSNLAFLHAITEKFVETALRHEQRLAAICLFFQNIATKDTALPRAVIDFAQPGSHLCQCPKCALEVTKALKEQLTKEIREEIRLKELAKALKAEELQATNQAIDDLWTQYKIDAKDAITPLSKLAFNDKFDIANARDLFEQPKSFIHQRIDYCRG